MSLCSIWRPWIYLTAKTTWKVFSSNLLRDLRQPGGRRIVWAPPVEVSLSAWWSTWRGRRPRRTPSPGRSTVECESMRGHHENTAGLCEGLDILHNMGVVQFGEQLHFTHHLDKKIVGKLSVVTFSCSPSAILLISTSFKTNFLPFPFFSCTRATLPKDPWPISLNFLYFSILLLPQSNAVSLTFSGHLQLSGSDALSLFVSIKLCIGLSRSPEVQRPFQGHSFCLKSLRNKCQNLPEKNLLENYVEASKRTNLPYNRHLLDFCGAPSFLVLTE